MNVTLKGRAGADGKEGTKDRVYAVGYEVNTVDGVVADLGEEYVVAAVTAAVAAEATRVCRRYEANGLTPEQIEEKMQGWKPGTEIKKVLNPVKNLTKKYEKLSDSEKAALRKALGLGD